MLSNKENPFWFFSWICPNYNSIKRLIRTISIFWQNYCPTFKVLNFSNIFWISSCPELNDLMKNFEHFIDGVSVTRFSGIFFLILSFGSVWLDVWKKSFFQNLPEKWCFSHLAKTLPNIWVTFEKKLSPRLFKSGHTGRSGPFDEVKLKNRKKICDLTLWNLTVVVVASLPPMIVRWSCR